MLYRILTDLIIFQDRLKQGAEFVVQKDSTLGPYLDPYVDP